MTRLILLLAIAGCAHPAAVSSGSHTPDREVVRARAGASDDAALTPADDSGLQVFGELSAPMPVAVTSFGATALGGDVYVLGGYAGTPHDYSRAAQSRSLWRLHDGAWSEVSTLEHGLQGAPLVTLGDRVCRVGGTQIVNAPGETVDMRSLAEVGCFDPDGAQWTALPALPEGRSSHEAAVIGSTIFVAGGWLLSGNPEEARWHDTVLALDTATEAPAWRAIDAPFRRRAVGVAAAGHHLVVVGGLTPERAISRQVDVLDTRTSSWTRGPDLPADGFGIAATSRGEGIAVSPMDGVVYTWAPGDEEFDRSGTLAFPRFFHQLVPIEGALVALGGISGMHTHGRTRHVERIRDSASLSGWSAPYPGEAKNRQAIFVQDDFLYLFGGNDSLDQHDFEPESFTAEGWRLHLPSMQFERIVDFPARRQTMATMVVDGRGLAVGGFGHDGETATSFADAFQFDFALQEWSPFAALPRGRTQFGMAAHDDTLWVVGGLNYDSTREGEAAFDHVTNLLVSRAESPSFETSAVTLSGPRRAFAGATLGDRYFMVGGMKGGFALVDDCQVFDLASRSFSPMTCPAHPRLGGDLLAVGERLYLVGGSTRSDEGMQSALSIEVYHPTTEEWSTALEELPFDTRHMRALVYGHRILLVSTHFEEARIRVAVFDPH